jgi:AcrR family transcriptional regulator
MGRKSLETQRREEILTAFERCIVKYGLEASLEQIADEAQVQRSLIRHYIGNRDALVDEVIKRIIHEILQNVEALGKDVAGEERLSATLDYLFRSEVNYDHADQVILQVLISAQERYPQAKQHLRDLFVEIRQLFAKDLAEVFSGHSPAKYEEIAYSVLCLAFTNESMMWLGLEHALSVGARKQAEYLIDQLKEV